MSMVLKPFIQVHDISFSYKVNEGTIVPVFDGISMTIHKGEYVAIIGHNGCGKSTLAKHLNGILIPQSGHVLVDGMNTRDKHLRKEIRKRVGMVFQSPDNQIVATIVEDDVAFGLENIGVEADEMRRRVDGALSMVGMSEFHLRPPHFLSGGQKQRVAIAGILSMQPACIVLDEATSMLDAIGRKEVLDVIDQLHQEGVAIVSITHHMSEVTRADRVLVMEEGRIVLEGTPREVFMQQESLRTWQLDVPLSSQVAGMVHEVRPCFRENRLNAKEIVEEVKRIHLQKAGVIDT